MIIAYLFVENEWENLLEYKNITPERKRKLEKLRQLFDEKDGISDVVFDVWSEFHGEYN